VNDPAYYRDLIDRILMEDDVPTLPSRHDLALRRLKTQYSIDSVHMPWVTGLILNDHEEVVWHMKFDQPRAIAPGVHLVEIWLGDIFGPISIDDHSESPVITLMVTPRPFQLTTEFSKNEVTMLADLMKRLGFKHTHCKPVDGGGSPYDGALEYHCDGLDHEIDSIAGKVDHKLIRALQEK